MPRVGMFSSTSGYQGQPLPNAAAAAMAAQYQQLYPHQPQPYPPHTAPAKYFAIDVECVATGTDHNARSVGQISLVDEYERVLLNIYVKPDRPVESYLSPLTGLNSDVLDKHGVPLPLALQYLRSYLPPYAVLVGQSIGKDVAWLSLREGVDFESMVDLAGLYRIWNSTYNSVSIFSLDHLAKVLLGYDNGGGPHNAVGDALKSMQLFNYYRQVHNVAAIWKTVETALLNTPVDDSFAKRYPCFEGVCMGNRKKCTCGAPFLG